MENREYLCTRCLTLWDQTYERDWGNPDAGPYPPCPDCSAPWQEVLPTSKFAAFYFEQEYNKQHGPGAMTANVKDRRTSV